MFNIRQFLVCLAIIRFPEWISLEAPVNCTVQSSITPQQKLGAADQCRNTVQGPPTMLHCLHSGGDRHNGAATSISFRHSRPVTLSVLLRFILTPTMYANVVGIAQVDKAIRLSHVPGQGSSQRCQHRCWKLLKGCC